MCRWNETEGSEEEEGIKAFEQQWRWQHNQCTEWEALDD